MTNAEIYNDTSFSLLPLKNGTKFADLNNWSGSKEIEDGRKIKPGDYESYGVRCGVELKTGEYLVVLDFDDISLYAQFTNFLQEKNYKLCDTFTVKTHKGLHFYYGVDDCHKTTRFEGFLDCQGHGSYVVGAGCKHPSGSVYEVLSDCPDFIETLEDYPRFLELAREFHYKFVKKNPGTYSALKAEMEEKSLSVDKKIPVGGRDNFFFRKACQLRATGLDVEEINFALQRLNKKQCEVPLSEAQIRKKAEQAAKYECEDALLEYEKAPTIKIEAQTSRINKTYNKVSAYDLADGKVKEIAENIYNSAKRPYKNFSLAAAFSIISSHAQGGYALASLFDKTYKGLDLNTYFWIVAPSSAGKDSYISAVKKYLDSTFPFLLLPEFASVQGFRGSMYSHNSRLYVQDEFQDDVMRIRDSQHLRPVFSTLKQLGSGVNKLSEQTLKNMNYPEVKKPMLSIFAVGTDSGLHENLDKNSVGGGLISRFIVPIIGIPSKKRKDHLIPPLEITTTQIKFLKNLYITGAVDTNFDMDTCKELLTEHQEYLTEIKGKTKKEITHQAQCVVRVLMSLDDDARDLYYEFEASQEGKYLSYHSQDNDSATTGGSVADRSPVVAYKLAGIHALGCGRTHVTVKDMEVGIAFARELADALQKVVDDHSFAHYKEKDAKLVLRKIKDLADKTDDKAPPINIRAIARCCTVSVASDMHTILGQLCTSEQIYAFGKGSKDPFDFSDGWPFPKNKFPRGTTFKPA